MLISLIALDSRCGTVKQIASCSVMGLNSSLLFLIAAYSHLEGSF
jgi:hypothetical protein